MKFCYPHNLSRFLAVSGMWIIRLRIQGVTSRKPGGGAYPQIGKTCGNFARPWREFEMIFTCIWFPTRPAKPSLRRAAPSRRNFKAQLRSSMCTRSYDPKPSLIARSLKYRLRRASHVYRGYRAVGSPRESLRGNGKSLSRPSSTRYFYCFNRIWETLPPRPRDRTPSTC